MGLSKYLEHPLILVSSWLIIWITYSLDSDTDAIVQKVIRHRFSNHTVIAVVHRVETIVDFDRVAVFSEGGLVEFDDPTVLLENETSLFKKLCDARGCVREST